MTAPDDLQEANKQPNQSPPESFVQAIFLDFGSTLFQLQVGQKVSPLQLIALGEYLKLLGIRQINLALTQQEEHAQQNRLIVPGMDRSGIKL